ncbi:hypothetical protein [Paenibacillus sp. MMS20-IR301]|uniref:hypothetical protein n=1 Tax=Paenibacillus sp. MMS20-IR301 TaxID=2895946 RepID=UPI0028E6DB86|nr:hypothetical protein [Paenibacillus sp. MMS20-IR301]WNS46511.1 hypothetical protein LOS79_15030 [Paenibacillus sp. MMS20-IR301]
MFSSTFSFLLLVLILTLSGCSNSDAELQKVSTQLEQTTSELKTANEKITALEGSLTASESKAEQLEKELSDLKNGPVSAIIEIRKQFEAKNYDQTLTLAATLHEKFSGVPEDNEAQKLVQEINSLKAAEAAIQKAAEEKKLAEASQSAKSKARSILRVSESWSSEPNSAGGVDLHIKWQNNSTKVAKYVYFSVEPYNAVEDIVGSEIGGTTTFTGRETGPFEQGSGSDGSNYWENAWYNNTITHVKLTQVTVDYMDGSTVTIQGEDLNYIQY